MDKEDELLVRIENLRKKLNQNIDKKTNTPRCNARTHALSQKLDKLIYRYMARI